MSGLVGAVSDDDIQRLRYIAEVLDANAQKYTIPDHVHGYADFLRTFADEITRLTARVAELEGALAWYGEQARLARLIHSGGDSGRAAIADDGGKRAKAALEPKP